MELLDVNREQLGILRNERHLPFIKLNRRKRLYFSDEVYKWLNDIRSRR